MWSLAPWGAHRRVRPFSSKQREKVRRGCSCGVCLGITHTAVQPGHHTNPFWTTEEQDEPESELLFFWGMLTTVKMKKALGHQVFQVTLKTAAYCHCDHHM